MRRLVLLMVPFLMGLFSACSYATMVVISGQGVVQDVGLGHQGFGFEEGASFWAEFRYEVPFESFPTGSVGIYRGFVAADVDIDGVHFSSSRLGSEIRVADSAVKRFRLNSLNMAQAPSGFPSLDMLMLEVRGGDIFNVHDFPQVTTDLDLDAATVLKIELEGDQSTRLSLDPETVTIEVVVPEPAGGLFWLVALGLMHAVRLRKNR